MSEAAQHACRFRRQPLWSDWRSERGLCERLRYSVPHCLDCGRVQPARRTRAPDRLERESLATGAPPVRTERTAWIAEVLAHRAAQERSFKSLRSTLRLPASLLEDELEHFLRAGWIALTWKLVSAKRDLERVRVRNREALEEFAHPGLAAERRATLEAARLAVQPLTHPVVADIAHLLAQPEVEKWSTRLLTALAAIACHAETGDQLAERVFSTHYLGSSKAFAQIRSTVERVLGRSVETLGIREGAAATFIGGHGHLRIGGHRVDLAALYPFVGFGRETLTNIEVELPAGGLLLVENFTVFDACCRSEVAGIDRTVVVWTAGYPGRGVRSLVEHAAGSGRIRIWGDLDLDGVRIARLVWSWAPAVIETFRMSPEDVVAAPRRIRLTDRARKAISTELDERPGMFLADTLRALLTSESWVEQECFLGPRVPDPTAVVK
jgi:hypothetical protein